MHPSSDTCHYLATSSSFYRYKDNEYTEINDLKYKVSSLADFDILPNGNIITSNVSSYTTLTKDGILNEFKTGVIGNIGSELSYSPTNPYIVYGFATAGGLFKMHRSRNGGLDWEEILSTNNVSFQHHDQTL